MARSLRSAVPSSRGPERIGREALSGALQWPPGRVAGRHGLNFVSPHLGRHTLHAKAPCGDATGLRAVRGRRRRRLSFERARLSVPRTLRAVGSLPAGGACTAIDACGPRNFFVAPEPGSYPRDDGTKFLHALNMEKSDGQIAAVEHAYRRRSA